MCVWVHHRDAPLISWFTDLWLEELQIIFVQLTCFASTVVQQLEVALPHKNRGTMTEREDLVLRYFA